MALVSGNTGGLKKNQLKLLARLAGKRGRGDQVIGPEMARALCGLSSELNRQIGILLQRSGKVEAVIVGDFKGILIPSLSHIRSQGRLKGLRLVHTHLANEDISDEDLMDLLFLRLDMLSVLKVDASGLPGKLYSVHLLPDSRDGKSWAFLPPVHPANQEDSFKEFIRALEGEFVRKAGSEKVGSAEDRAILVSVSSQSQLRANESMNELVELAKSDNVAVLDTVVQRRRKANPRFILGKGKLADIMIMALQLGANLLIFDHELNPSQIRSITRHTELRVIDRTQLILDIFAHRALSREGKLQIEMAQLKYMLPRLSNRDDALSRLTGGIGARGPGETKLEIDKRRINDRLARLKKELKKVSKERSRRRSRRRKKNLPVLSLVGYTNAGKSTLLNTLTQSDIVAEDKLFATLDPTSRRLRFPQDMEVVITDTVGFIRNLPADLLQAFKATLEELEEADLLVHVIDLSNPCYHDQVKVVEDLLRQLDLSRIPCLKVFNKADKIGNDQMLLQEVKREGIVVSALHKETLQSLLTEAQKMMGKILGQ